MNKQHWLKGKKNLLFGLHAEMQMYGSRQESRTLPWVKYQIFLETIFTYNNIDNNLNENFRS